MKFVHEFKEYKFKQLLKINLLGINKITNNSKLIFSECMWNRSVHFSAVV